MSDKLKFLDEQRDAPAAEPTPQAEPAPTPEPAQAAATQPEPTEPAHAQAPVDAAQEARDGRERDPETGKFVPPGLLDERRKRQELEKKLKDLEQRLNTPQQPVQQPYVPTVTEDPDGWAQDIEARAYNQRLDTSEMIVRGQAGDEVVDAAQQAFLEARQNDPSLQQKFDSQKHPYAWLMSWHKQHQIMSEIGTDPEAWRNAQLEKLRAELLQSQKTPAAVAQPSAPSQQPPPSLAAQPAARHAPTPHVGPGNAFDRAIPR